MNVAKISLRDSGKVYFRLFSNSAWNSSEVVAEQERLGYPVEKFGPPQGFSCDDLLKGTSAKAGANYVVTWHVEEQP